MYKFKGQVGEYLAGVPAHDLNDDDVAQLTPEQKDLLDAHMKTSAPLYELKKDKPAEAKADAEDKPTEAKTKAKS